MHAIVRICAIEILSFTHGGHQKQHNNEGVRPGGIHNTPAFPHATPTTLNTPPYNGESQLSIPRPCGGMTRAVRRRSTRARDAVRRPGARVLGRSFGFWGISIRFSSAVNRRRDPDTRARADDIPGASRAMISCGLRAMTEVDVVFRKASPRGALGVSPAFFFKLASFEAGSLLTRFGRSTATPARAGSRSTHRTRLLLGTTLLTAHFAAGTETVARAVTGVRGPARLAQNFRSCETGDSRRDISVYGSRRSREATIGARTDDRRHRHDVPTSRSRDDLVNCARGCQRTRETRTRSFPSNGRSVTVKSLLVRICSWRR